MNKQDASNEMAPVAERVISDVATLKAMSDPVRLRLLETMICAPDENWTVKRLATALGVNPTKLYHHINVLEEHEFIRAASTRVVSGIIETSYRVTQLNVRLDRKLLSASNPDGASSVHEVLSVILGTVQEDIEQGIRNGLILAPGEAPAEDDLQELFIRGLTNLTPERATELRKRLRAVLEEYDVDSDGSRFGYLVTLYPLKDTKTKESTDD